jgi:hypothetical protein
MCSWSKGKLVSRPASDRIRSDHAYDYYWLFQNRLEREFAYWLAPEQVTETGMWLATVLNAVELMILFEQDIIDFSINFGEEKAVKRWRDVFLSVWDAEWENDNRYGHNDLYGKPEYRKQHRPIIVAMFNFLESVARYGANISKHREELVLSPLLPDYPLPYFSITRWTNSANKEVISVGRITHDMIEQLVKDIIYGLSLEKREEGYTINTEDVWVAVDILGFLCETYEQSPEVNDQMVRTWRETAIEIWKQFLSDDIEWDETDPLNQNVMAAFDRLEAVARTYPPEW